MKIYLAGAWHRLSEIKAIGDHLKNNGHELTSSWTTREHGQKTIEKCINDAIIDIDEVKAADIVVAIMNEPNYPYRGTCCEIGCALGLNKQVLAICPGEVILEDNELTFTHDCMSNVFFWHPNVVHVKNVYEAVVWLNQ